MAIVVCIFKLTHKDVHVSLEVTCISTERISSPAVSISAAVWMVWWAVCPSAHTTSLCLTDTVPTPVLRPCRIAVVRNGYVMMTTALGKTHQMAALIMHRPIALANSWTPIKVYVPFILLFLIPVY